MKLLSKLLLITIVLFGSQAIAKNMKVSGVSVADNLNIESKPMLLNGSGVRSKFFFDLYVGSLYLSNTTKDADKAMNETFAAIRLNIISGLITKDKMQEAIVEGFEHATHDNVKPIQSQIDEFMSLFDTGIKEGDQFTFVFHKGVGVTAYKNMNKLTDIKNETFRKALMAIWIGDKPAQKSLKKDMLAQ
ncbi:chalcone isomerase family protein [Shewanella sp. 202IG2-18]|uniref:chalcone isomerase family protein n=1 Tax=Parashewanella hymeniacidonis TaxID=2807618 RepID=UPI001961685F|nr:chalcone isomerase family protein [Parashewanella hymeniacidonis]MBM7074508.1 chalcone isomerase family protein [Parashewanella hymeniacidonis]